MAIPVVGSFTRGGMIIRCGIPQPDYQGFLWQGSLVKMGVVLHVCNLSIQEAEVEGL